MNYKKCTKAVCLYKIENIQNYKIVKHKILIVNYSAAPRMANAGHDPYTRMRGSKTTVSLAEQFMLMERWSISWESRLLCSEVPQCESWLCFQVHERVAPVGVETAQLRHQPSPTTAGTTHSMYAFGCSALPVLFYAIQVFNVIQDPLKPIQCLLEPTI